MDVITYPCGDFSQFMLLKGAPEHQCDIPAVLGENVRKDGVTLQPGRPITQLRRHAEPTSVLSKGHVRWTCLEVKHPHDDVSLAKRLSVDLEFAANREAAGTTIAPGVWILACRVNMDVNSANTLLKCFYSLPMVNLLYKRCC